MARANASHRGSEDRRNAEDDLLTRRVIGAALHLHTRLGPGLLESVYERCLAMELAALGLHVQRQVAMPLAWRGVALGDAFRLDLVVEHDLVVEIKAVDAILPVHKAQVITYLRLGGFSRGLLFNFNTAHLRDGITRVVNSSANLRALPSSV